MSQVWCKTRYNDLVTLGAQYIDDPASVPPLLGEPDLARSSRICAFSIVRFPARYRGYRYDLDECEDCGNTTSQIFNLYFRCNEVHRPPLIGEVTLPA